MAFRRRVCERRMDDARGVAGSEGAQRITVTDRFEADRFVGDGRFDGQKNHAALRAFAERHELPLLDVEGVADDPVDGECRPIERLVPVVPAAHEEAETEFFGFRTEHGGEEGGGEIEADHG